MSTNFYIFIFLSFFCFESLAQKAILSGYIVDKKSGEALIGATVYDSNTKTASTTNKFGFYTLLLNKNIQHSVQISYMGYDPDTTTVFLRSDTVLNIALDARTWSLSEVVVKAKSLEESLEMGKVNIPLLTIKNLPSLMGEADILKAYQLMPGVQAGAEGNNGLFVRGGTPDQNLFLLDDVPLYNVSHLGGLFSVFDPSIVKSVDLYKGGFPARYGGRISSVVDVRNKEGNLNKRNGEIGLGILSSKFFLEGPISKGQSSYALSARYCNFGIYSYLLKKMQNLPFTSGYMFYDVNLKVNLKVSDSDRLFLSAYNGLDDIYVYEKDVKEDRSDIKYSGSSDLMWGSTAGSVRWLHVFKNGVFNNTTIAYSKYKYENLMESSTEFMSSNSVTNNYFRIHSGTDDLWIKNDAEIPLENMSIKMGTVSGVHSYIPSEVKFSKNGINSPSSDVLINAQDVYGYAELEYKIGDKISSNTGCRAGVFHVNQTLFPVLEPRVVFNYLFIPSYSFKASYSSMHQNIHLLTNSNSGMPTDIWVPSTNLIKPESSNQYAVGFAHTTKDNYEMSVELYYKKLQNLIDYKEGVLLYGGSSNWESKVEVGGEGEVKGMEFLLSKKTGLITGWIGYTLSSNTRTFQQLNNGMTYPFTYDQRHNVSVVGNYKISKNITFSATWIYHTGNSITLPSAKYKVFENYGTNEQQFYADAQIYSDKNAYRMPDYHRLDIGINRSKQMKKGVRNWSLNLYNAYNRQNAYYLFYKKTADGELKLYQRSLFPILFNAGYSYVF